MASSTALFKLTSEAIARRWLTQKREIQMEDKMPRLKELFKQVSAEKVELLKVVAPARETYEKLINDPKLVEARKVIKEFNPKLAKLDQELAGLAKALGGKNMKLETGVYDSKEIK